MKKRFFSIFTALALLFSTLPVNALAVGNSGAGGLCEHHPAHTAECGYAEGAEGTPCNHEHTEDCYTLVEKCVHEHTDECYPEESVSGNTATPGNAEEQEPTECAHECSEDTGCIKKELDCQHEHNDDCGYIPATKGTSCTFVCKICGEESTEQEENTKAKDVKCICESLCTGEKVNANCPVCGVEDADLTLCKGEPEQAQNITITSFDELPEEVQAQFVPAGTKLADLDLPDTLGASGYVGMQDSGGAESLTIEGVTWESDPDYDENAEGSWLFTAKLPENYTLLDGVELPQIGVMAEPVNLLTAQQISDSNLYWELVDGTLTITGTGAMPDFGNLINRPWADQGDNIKEVVVDGGVTSIGRNAFQVCRNLTSVRLPDGVTSIGENAFWKCESLTSIKLPDGLISIGSDAFNECAKLEQVELPDSLEYIGNYAFYYCESLTKLTLPPNLRAIGNEAFRSCAKLEEITFTGMQAPILGSNVFLNCNALTDIYIPEGATGYDGPNWPADIVHLPVPYLACDQNGQNWETENRTDYTLVDENNIPTGSWKDGWYVVSGEVTVSDRIKMEGNVHLILTENCNFKAEKGIQVDKNNSLTIYAQSEDETRMGHLNATAENNHAGIGGGANDGGNITIYGGKIDATGGRYGAGIGGSGWEGHGGNTTIYGGSVTATGGISSAGIGGGYNGDGGTVIIRGGDVTATGSDYGAGIGGSVDGKGGNITISGGTVTANSGDSSTAAAIGGFCGTINISGGFVTAMGGSKGIVGSFSTTEQGNAVIVTNEISDQSGKSGWNGVIIETDKWGGQIYGQNVTPTDDFTIPKNMELTIPEDSTLTIKDTITATNEGTIYKYGAISGTVTNVDNGVILEESSMDVFVSDFNGPITEVFYGDSFFVNATVEKAVKNRAMYEGSVVFYVEMNGQKTSLGLGKVINGKAQQHVNMSGGAWKDKKWKPGEYTITAEFQNSDILIKNSGQTALEVICNHNHNTNTTNDCTASVQCSICNVTLQGQTEHKFNWTSDNNGTTHTGKDCANKTCTNGACTQTKTDNCSGGTATCTQKATCEKCGAEYGELAAHNMTHYEANAATCSAPGNVEYWSCSECNKNYDSETNGKVIDKVTTEIDPDNHVNTTSHDRQEPTCTDVGYKEGTYCNDCKTWISGHNEISAKGHNFTAETADTKYRKSAATCIAEAVYYKSCVDCHESSQGTADEATFTSGGFGAHNMTPHEAQAATCTSAGNKEHWSCDVCGKNFSDADGKTELQDVTIPELGHDWDAWKANNDGTHSHTCKRNSSHTKTESCSFGADDKCTICGGDKPIATYTVTFNSQGGSSVGSQTITSGGKVKEPAAPEKKGFTFAGWYNGSTKWDFAKDIVTGNLTLTAHWTADTPTPADKYEVKVEKEGNGTASASPSSAKEGETIILTAKAESGYHFERWEVVFGGVTISGGSFKMPANNVIVKAVFEKNDDPTPPEKEEYSVTVNGSYSATNGAGNYKTNATVTIDAGSRSNYRFTGWTVSDGVTLADAGSSRTTFTMPGKDVTVTANWKYTGGGSSGGNTGGGNTGGDSGSGSGGGSTIITRPDEKHPDIPTTSETKPVKPDKDGNVSIGGDSIQDAIDKATTDANKNGNKENGIAVTVPVDNKADAQSLTVTIPAETLDKLVSAKVRRFDITTNGLPCFSFTLDTLKMLDKQSLGGDLILRLTKTTVTSKQAKEAIGSRPAYDITLVFVKDGKETPFTDWQGKTVSVKLPYTPAKDEQGGNLYAVYVDANGKVEWLTKSSYNADQKAVIFEASHFSVYGVGYKNPAPVFTDITGHWAADNIIFVASRGLLAGTGNNKFSPNTGMTRGMFVTALGRLAGIDPESYKTDKFTDVKADAYYAPYVNWAAEKGIVSGTSATTFSPDTNITREQMAVIMANYAKKMGYDLPVALEAVTFVDNAQISSWAAKEVKAMQQAGIMAGKGGNRFDPKGTATRAEVATVLRRFVEIVIDPQAAQGWMQDHSGFWQYMKDGKAVIGWLYDDKKWYWLDQNGKMFASGWKQISGKWYYFYSDGSMAVNTTIDGYTIGPDGARK
jgi:uncharacterized repeat protein (TIGR02543 family)